MHLKSLTLKGFKSFAQSTTFQFEPGVTAIVGPNGSGKSNVVDALAWVMGEQGVKTLRGGKMEDVIFAGTEVRGPLGRAEVRLTIDNSGGALPIEYSEVTISRTLFRNGGSEYAINGESCRLLDLQELLSDSGLGREMHVIVGQGQLDAVLRATPEDRRGFIEEAAGILKHRRRKERTLRKLEAMEANLTRLNDLAGELRRQLKPLGRQAEVARRAQHIAAEVRDAKARLLADDVSRLRGELVDLAKGEKERHAERIVLEEQASQKQARIAGLEAEQHDERLDAARRVTLELGAVEGKLRGLLAQTQQRLTFLATQTDDHGITARLSPDELEGATSEVEHLEALIPEAERAWQAARARTQEVTQALNDIDAEIAEQGALVAQYDLVLSQLDGRAATAKARHTAAEQDRDRRAVAVTQAGSRLAVAQQQLADFEQAQRSEDGSPAGPDAALEAEGQDRDTAYKAAQAAQQASEHEHDVARDQLHTLEQLAAGLSARAGALTRSLDERDASAQLITEAPAGVIGRVADHTRVSPGSEAAIAAALGVFADALLVETDKAASAAVGTARDRDLGRLRAVFGSYPSPPTEPATDDVLSATPSIQRLTRVIDLITEAPAGVWGVLKRSYVADTIEAAMAGARELRETHPGEPFTIVTRDGDVLTPHTLSGGSSGAPSRLELVAELEQTESKLATVQQRAAELRERLGVLRADVVAAKEAAQLEFTELRAADARRAELTQQRHRLVTRAEVAQTEMQRAEQALAEAAASTETTLTGVNEAEKELDAARGVPRPMIDAGQRTAAHETVEASRALELEARLVLETARERARSAAAHLARLSEQQETERAEHVAGTLPVIIAACGRSFEEARSEQQEAEVARAIGSQELTLLRSEAAELRQRLGVITEFVHGSEMKSYERKLQLTALLERAGAELGLSESVLLTEYGPETLIPVPETEDLHDRASNSGGEQTGERGSAHGGYANALEAELARELGLESAAPTDPAVSEAHGATPHEQDARAIPYVRAEQEARLAEAERRLAQLGRINPLALEEFAALEQRHQFLAEQLTDLTQTRTDLMAIIGDLDRKMQGIFAEAFADTQAAFARVFPVLFPGGTGEVFLTEPDDLLTTGIEMVVRPAGKKVARLSLLSGGERSLAAVAWLIAIFQARPSPFYIMDEVEAALDDANLGRLLRVFEELRQNSQLIVITHQKRTMEIADALYGVSMRQDGISAVVGQRIGPEA